MCISSDSPHFDWNFPNVSVNLLKICSRETAAQILMRGTHLYGFTEVHCINENQTILTMLITATWPRESR